MRGALRRMWAAVMLAVIGLVLGVLIATAVSVGAFVLYRLGQRAASKSSAAAVTSTFAGTNGVSRYGFGPHTQRSGVVR